MSEYTVTVAWLGRPAAIRLLYTALLHLQPAPVGATPTVRVTVSATDATHAELYVRRVLVREGLEGKADVLSVVGPVSE
jgi:hypothetical protein